MRYRARRPAPTCCSSYVTVADTQAARSGGVAPQGRRRVGRRPVLRARRDLQGGRAAAWSISALSRARRSRSSPTPARVDLLLLWHPHRRRHARHDLPDELPGGVRVRPRPLRLARGLRRGRRAAGQGPRGRGALPGAAARDRDGRARRTSVTRSPWPPCASAGAAATSPSGRPATRPSPRRTSASTSTPTGTTGPPKGCLLSHANYRTITNAVAEAPRPHSAAATAQPLPAARPCVRDPDPVARPSTSA